MKRCSFCCAGWWPFLLFPLLLLLLFGLFKWRAIEQDVSANATQSLSAQAPWAEVETYSRGRDVLITGTAPDEAAVEQAKQLALAGNGVRVAKFAGDISAPSLIDPSLNVSWNNGKIVLRGELSDQAAIDSIVAQANKVYGADNVVNELSVGNQIGSLGSINGLFPALNGLSDGDSLSIANNGLTLNGSVESADIKATIASQLGLIFDGDLNNLLTIDAPKVIKSTECQNLVNTLLQNAKIEFDSGKADIKASSFELLENISGVATRCPDASFEISGHTDSTGNLAFNMSLSEQRAQAVASYLIKSGLNSQRFTAVGHGPSKPIATNSTREGRAQNRRIEFNVKN